MLNLLKKIFGTEQSRILKRYQKIVKNINEIESSLGSLSDQQLRAKTEELKKKLSHGASVDTILEEAFAVVKNACRRLCGQEIHVSGYNQKWDMIPYDVQMLGAIAMHHRSIAEMQTGEGKTLTAVMPLYLHALTGKPTHLVTVNDYLAQRDCQWIGEIFRFLGLTVKALTNETPLEERKSTYLADIVYGTASEFGFDYLRDNSMAQSKNEVVQRGHYFAIIDEIDSILIDEARTPLIISGPIPSSNQLYHELKNPVSTIVKIQRDYCNKLATDAKRILDKYNLLEESETPKKLLKEEQKEVDEALRKLWLVSKGTPTNKVLKRVKENPDLRKQLEDLETYFYAEQNKEEKSKNLSELYIIVDERSSDYELTDKGIQQWAQYPTNSEDDFLMLDLGYEYAQVDEDTSLSDDEKLQKKITLREDDSKRKEKAHNVRQLFRAHLLMEKDVDYIIENGKIVIIDENTGRPQPGRRFSDGLHQSIEAKENVAIQQETQTYATITLQNYFRMYSHLGGMTGTAMTEANEFKQIYQLKVLAIPTHRPCKRVDADDEIYMTEREKYQALLKDITQIHNQGRPILIGTESVDISEKLSRILRQNRLEHTVLNAKNHAKEAEIIASAGAKSAITVATNMAGRGTDIKLGDGIAQRGGLHVIGTTRHHSRRIDRQLRGRCARQGDPGTSKFYVSFEDTLMRLFTSPKLSVFLQRFRPPEGEPISAPVLNRSIETAQKRIEQRNFSMRKHTLEYDDVMNKQRQEVYNFRNEVLYHENSIKLACSVLEDTNAGIMQSLLTSSQKNFDLATYLQQISLHFPVAIEHHELEGKKLTHEEIETIVYNKISDTFKQKLEHEAKLIAALQKTSGKEINPLDVLIDVLRSLIIKTIDRNWQEHLLAIDNLRSEVNMRVVGQKDPLIEFKQEAFHLFHEFSNHVKTEISHALFSFEMMLHHSKQLYEAVQKTLNQEKFATFVHFDD
ncbi:MAG: preprotein translocase subunit SecA [Chlamydiales bacterium]|nr:preprotein translocase subunit SecA [Chlamydiales bacterium]